MVKKELNGKQVIEGIGRGRTVSIVGLATAFLASALSVLTANIRGESSSRSLFILTAFLWLLAIVGMILWLYGRSVLRKSADGGGWLAQNVQPDVPGLEWAAFMAELSEPAGAEDLYVECIQYLRLAKPAFPVRADLSWLRGDGEDYTYAVVMFYPASEESAAVRLIETCLQSSSQGKTVIGTESGPRIREDYYRRLGACGASMWLQES